MVEINDLGLLREDLNDSIIFDEFVTRAEAWLDQHPMEHLSNYDIYIGFWGQWSVEIPSRFFALVDKTRLKVTLDIGS